MPSYYFNYFTSNANFVLLLFPNNKFRVSENSGPEQAIEAEGDTRYSLGFFNESLN